MALCTQAHGSKDRGKGGVSLPPMPIPILLISLTSGGPIGILQNKGWNSRRDFTFLAARDDRAGQARHLGWDDLWSSLFGQAPLTSWNNLDWSGAAPLSGNTWVLVEFAPRQLKMANSLSRGKNPKSEPKKRRKAFA